MEKETIIEQVVQSGVLAAIEFGIMSSAEIKKYSSFTLLEKDDVSSPKLGFPNGLEEKCRTCGTKNVRDCDGHFGAINLPATIYHPYFIAEVVQTLNQICPSCLSVKQDFDKDTVTLEVNNKSSGYGSFIFKTIQKKLSGVQKKSFLSYLKNCVKTVGKNWGKTERKSNCKHCMKSSLKWYPMMRFKMSRDLVSQRSLQITAEIAEKQIPKKYQNKSLDEVLAGDFWDFVPRDVQQQEPNKSKITLTPYQAFTLLKELDPDFIEKFISKREWAFLSSIPVTANNHRVSETYPAHADGPLLVFDELTRAYRRIIDASRKIDDFHQHPQFKALAGSYVTNCAMECLAASKLHSKQSNGEPTPGNSHGVRWLKDMILSKRTDHVFRIVMVGDAKIKLSEIGIPSDIAKNLLVTEHVNPHNIEKLSSVFVKHFTTAEQIKAQRDGRLVTLKKNDNIQIGDMVYRPLESGDIVLINRPPSVHQHSLIGLTVKILPTRHAASINPLNCAPLLGDFDGDCLHGYVPQSIRCRVELSELVSLGQQLFNSQDGKSLVSLSHDSLLAASLLTRMDTCLNRYQFQQLEMFCLTLRDIVPSVLKSANHGTPLWTGLQLFSSFLPPDMDFSLFQKMKLVSQGEMLICPSTSQWLKGGKNDIFYHMFRKYGKRGLEHLFAAQETLCEFLTMQGLTVSLSDLYLSPDSNARNILKEKIQLAIEEAEDALKLKQLVLNPEMLTVLMDQYYEPGDIPDRFSENFSITKISIGAFKDVFSDIVKLASLHLRKDNSMLEMINSGSKGSLVKLVHQTLCLGLQLPGSKFPFTIPSDLSCISWNNHKVTMERGQSSYAVIGSSFLDGLNPLECLLHAISGRANFFSDNAEVPGTLNRELMYYLRDIQTAYDGSVRDAHGHQIVQFSYGADQDDVIGAPVGAWAASAVSEAAYGALDCPSSGLEESPLMNLKKVLKCDKGRASEDHAAVLYLSPNLQKYKYGSEYAALEIQSYLEPVLFSELVDIVLISHDECEGRGFKGSPYGLHFHLNKDIMKRKRINLISIITRLKKNYTIKRKSEGRLPALRMYESSCSLDNESNDDPALCLLVAADTSDLDTAKFGVIPLLLRSVVRGFEEIKRVEIKCPSEKIVEEIYLRVTVSVATASGDFWRTIQNACIPIMDLIDWSRSRPDTIHEIFGVLGVDSTWSHFLSCLKGSISDIGREIQREHLMTVADSLSVSGEFHGLSSKGLKAQRKRLGLSAPFTQACFSGPATTFIAAAKEGSVDGLSGTLDSISWGKEPLIGSGGHFDLIFPAKEDKPKESDNIYKFLERLLPKDPRPSQSRTLVKREVRPSSSRHEGLHRHADKKLKSDNHKDSRLCLSPMHLSSIGSWSSIVDMHASLRSILHHYPINTCVNEADKKSLIEALTYHPRGHEKIGTGVRAIKIGRSQEYDGSRCFILIQNSGNEDEFSYRKCIIGAASKISPELKLLVETKLFGRRIW